jgi:acetyl esterase/lipase
VRRSNARTTHAGVIVLIVLLATIQTVCGSDQSSLQRPSTYKFASSSWGQMEIVRFGLDPTKKGEIKPLLVFFHGGGWKFGNMYQFGPEAQYLTSQGQLVVMSVDYPLTGDPISETKAALAATCWIRRNSVEFGIDPSRIAVSGGSAGGQLAASMVLINQSEVRECDQMPPQVAQALILFNPALDLKGRWEKYVGLDLRSVSPIDIVHGPLPPTLILQGTADRLTPLSVTRSFVERAKELGSKDITIVEFPGRQHGFFNNRKTGDMEAALLAVQTFLDHIGWTNFHRQ